MYLDILLLIIGLAVLILGAHWLVDGASSIATRLGVSALTVGLTVVAFGTSTPELVVNLIASFKGSSGLAIGNVVGSNSINILLILGLSAVIRPIAVKSQTVRFEIPLSLLAAVMLFLLANDMLFDATPSILSRSDGLVLLVFFALFIYYTYLSARTDKHPLSPDVKQQKYYIAILMVIGGIGGLYLGGKFIVDSATNIARSIGISDLLIGLTVVAIGTSLPEMATSIIAAYKRNSDIAVGNIVGSNIFNIFMVLGVSGSIKPLPFSPESNIDILVVCFASVLLFFFSYRGKRPEITRMEGAIMVICYLVYFTYLIVNA